MAQQSIVNISFFGLEAAKLLTKELGSKSAVSLSSLEGAKKRAVKRTAFAFQSRWKRNLSGPSTKRTLGVRTGDLRRSIRLTFTKNKDRATIGTDSRYAEIHEFGGVITAKNAPFLVFMGDVGHLVRVRRVRMPERPHHRKTQEDLKGRLEKMQEEEIEKTIFKAHRMSLKIRNQRTEF